MHLNDRDLAILADVGEYGCLDTILIHRRHWPPDTGIRACQNRLKKLVEAKLLRPARLTVSQTASTGKLIGGRLATAFSLSSVGADLVEQATGRRPARVSKSELAEVTLLHRLRTVYSRVAIEDAAVSLEMRGTHWIMEQDSLPDARPGMPIHERMVLFERFGSGRDSVSCRPDASCLLWIPRGSEYRPLILYWEVDRSTNRLSAELEKCAGYQNLMATNRYAIHWPETVGKSSAQRVFYVCNTQTRIKNIAEKIRDEPVAKAYRFSTHDQLQQTNPVTDKIWSDINGKLYAIWNKPAGR